jgi:hypothetical protein
MENIFIITIPSSRNRLAKTISKLNFPNEKIEVIEKAESHFSLRWVGVKYGYFDQYKKYMCIFRKIVKLNRPCLILEDDALAIDGWNSTLLTAPQNSDFLFLSDDHFNHPVFKVDHNWYKCRWSKTTCATVFSPRAAKSLLRWQFICKHPMDWTINYLLKQKNNLNSYWHMPGVFMHGTMSGIYQSSIK